MLSLSQASVNKPRDPHVLSGNSEFQLTLYKQRRRKLTFLRTHATLELRPHPLALSAIMPATVGIIVFGTKERRSAVVHSSVREDWSALLPASKKNLFEAVIRQWENAYWIFSVALDEAFALRADGKLIRARQCAEIASGTVGNLTEPLAAACRMLAKAGRHLACPPAVAPLNPAFYRGDYARQSAQWNQLTHHILFGSRSRFLHKLRILEIMAPNLADTFRRACEALSSESNPRASWECLDEVHYDVNTCLRETVVVFKSFLLAIPEATLSSFESELNASLASTHSNDQNVELPLLLGRRAGHFRRE